MQLVARRTAAVAAVAVLALGWTLVASPAAAVDTIPTPIDVQTWELQMRQRVYGLRAPGSTLVGASGAMTPIQRVAGVARNAKAGTAGVTLVPSAAISDASGAVRKAGVKAAGAVGTAATALFVLDLAYDAASGGMGSGFGFAGLTGYESQGLACDLKALALGDYCDLGPTESYVVNSDVTPVQAGWVGNANAAGPYIGTNFKPSGSLYGWNDLTVRADVESAPAWGATTASVAVRVTLSGSCVQAPTGYASQAPYISLTLYQAGGTVGSFAGNPGVGGNVACADGVRTVTLSGTVTGASYFDRLVVHVEGNGTAYPTRPAPLDLVWWPEGKAGRSTGVDADPARTWVTEWRCADGATGSASVGPWHESEGSWPAPAEPSCAGSPLEWYRVQQTSPGVAAWTFVEWSAPAVLGEFAAAYPQCGNGACVLELLRVDPTTGARVACFDNPDGCLGWFEDPAKADNYVCTYGGADVALSECDAYAPLFDSSRRTAAGPLYADPATGLVAEGTGGTVVSDPGAGCGSAPAFEFSLGGVGYWVAHGTEWALCQAFVPDAASLATMRVQFEADVGGKAPFAMVAAVPAVVSGVSQGWSAGCTGLPNFAPPAMAEAGAELRMPCAPPGSPGWDAAKALMGVLVGVLVVQALWTLAHHAFGGKG